jgi:hypothetical protein
MPSHGAAPRTIAATALAGLAELAATALIVLAFSLPASAQFWDWRPVAPPPPRPRAPTGQFQQMFGPAQPGYQRQEADYSRAPAPRKPDTAPLTNILVLGDSMADWLAYGLEDALSDAPEFGIIRKHRTTSGLIRYDQRADYDWTRAAREILAAEKPNFVVMMIGLQDRQSIRDRPTPARPAAPAEQSAAAQPAPGQPAPDQAGAQTDQDDDTPDQPNIAGPERPRRAATGGTYEFRTEKWSEVYAKRIDDTIAVLKSKGVPVFWVGLPAVRGARSTTDMIYLNNIFRSRAEKAGIVYVDVWDGFIDERNSYTASGPDFAGQIRRLRTEDGVHFTRAGARKLAHYVEREIRRAMSRSVPIAIPGPLEQQQQQTTTMRPGITAPRPLAGPVVPLALTGPTSEDLVGGGVINTGTPDPVAARVLVKGEPLPTPVGRADDFQWPPRQPEGPEPPIAAAPAATPPAAARSAAAPATQPQGGGATSRSTRSGQTSAATAESPSRAQTRTAPPQPARQAPAASTRSSSSSVPRPPMPIGGDRPVTGGW